MRINPMNAAQFALKPGQVSPIAQALQQAPQYMQALQKAQQSMIGTQAAKNTLAFQNPLLQQALAEKTGIAQTATGIGQQEIAKGAISPQMVQAQLSLAQQHAGLAAQHTQQAAIATNVAAKTMQAHVAGQQAITAQQQQKAALAAEVTKMYPGLTNAQKVQMVTGMQNVLAQYPVQRVGGAFKGAQAATNTVLAGAANNSNMGGSTLSSNQNVFMTPQQMTAYYSNPNVPINEKISKLRVQAENTYDYNHKSGSWKKLTNSQRNNFLKQYAQKYGIK